MKIALLISGRETRYEACLLPMLEKTEHNIDLFISINDEECEYYEIMKSKLAKWLKGIYIKPYNFPDNFKCTYRDDFRYIYQLINDIYLPKNILSSFFNDNNAFNMAIKYADDNYFEYDYYVKFRADIIADSLPIFEKPDHEIYKIFNVEHFCKFYTFGKYSKLAISTICDWGNRKSMNIYCNTYRYALEQNILHNFDYIFHFESNIIDNLFDNNIELEYRSYKYSLDKNRKMFDINWKEDNITDSRKINIPDAINYIDIKTIKSLPDIPATPCIYSRN